MLTEQEALHVLGQRRDWLTARITAKQTINWDVEWDERERDALSLILRTYQQADNAEGSAPTVKQAPSPQRNKDTTPRHA